jgi:hypothetical protein
MNFKNLVQKEATEVFLPLFRTPGNHSQNMKLSGSGDLGATLMNPSSLFRDSEENDANYESLRILAYDESPIS